MSMHSAGFPLPHEALFKKSILIVTGISVLIGGPLLISPLAKLKGQGLNSRAWRASYSERHLPVPAGPREGWWGVNITPRHDGQLGIVLPERHVPGYFEIDRWGMQTVIGAPHPQVHLLIVGGSVAAGAYASNLGRTYFAQLAHRLSAAAGRPVQVTVLATGAWTSENELQAFRFRGAALKPDYVIFLNGMNDLILYKQWPEEKRVEQYLTHMRQARDIALAHHIKVIFSPQPFLPEKKKKTGYEVLILAESYPRVDRLIKAHEDMMAGLRLLEIPEKVYVEDCSGAFDKRRKTVFSDIWHFSDIGQAILAKELTRDLAPLLIFSKIDRHGSSVHPS
jgi:lysophospholipase L1-like esterase